MIRRNWVFHWMKHWSIVDYWLLICSCHTYLCFLRRKILILCSTLLVRHCCLASRLKWITAIISNPIHIRFHLKTHTSWNVFAFRAHLYDREQSCLSTETKGIHCITLTWSLRRKVKISSCACYLVWFQLSFLVWS